MLVTPASFRAPMARFRQVAIARGALPVRSWVGAPPGRRLGSVLGERGVPDVMQGLDVPVVANQLRELGRGGLVGGQAGDGVDGLDGGPAGLAVGAAALDLDGLAGAGEEQVVHGGDLDAADLEASVTGVLGAALEWDVLPGKGLELLAELLRRVSRAARCPRWGRLRAAAPRTGRASFPASGSPVVLLRGRLLVDGGVAVSADDQGLPSTGSHGLHPGRGGRGAVSVEVGDSFDVVDGDPVSGVAQFADLGGEPGDELASAPGRPSPVDQTGMFAPTQRDASKPGGEHLARRGALDCLEAPSFPVRGADSGSVTVPHHPRRAAVLRGQGGEHRPFHHEAELVEPVDVPCQLEVLDITSILRAEGGDDVVVAGADQVVADQGFALSAQIGPASGVDGLRRDAQGDGAVERAAAAGVPAVSLPGPDVVAEEPRLVGAGMGDQGFLGGELEFQLLAQERGEPVLDLFGFGLGADEPQKVIVGVAR